MTPNFLTLLRPRYWPYWLPLGILRILVVTLPYKSQVYLGKKAGKLLLRFSNKTRSVATINLKLCFPKASESEHQQLLQKNFEAVGIALFEAALAWWGSEKQLQKIPFKIIGAEHLQLATQNGRGAMLCSPHFTTAELVGRLLTRHIKIATMYRPQKQIFLEYITYHSRKKNYQRLISRNDIRGMLRALKDNLFVWYAADIDAGLKNSIFAPFFGVLAATITATSRYAKITATQVIPTFFYREDNGYTIIFKPPLENFPSDHLEQDASTLNQVFEQAILHYPEQYLWQYKRFKTRPNGEPRFYDKPHKTMRE